MGCNPQLHPWFIPLFTPGFGIPQLLGSLILRLIAWASSFRLRGFHPKFGVPKMYQSTFWYPKMAGIFCWIFHLQIFQKLFASDSTCEKTFNFLPVPTTRMRCSEPKLEVRITTQLPWNYSMTFTLSPERKSQLLRYPKKRSAIVFK